MVIEATHNDGKFVTIVISMLPDFNNIMEGNVPITKRWEAAGKQLYKGKLLSITGSRNLLCDQILTMVFEHV